LLPLLGAAAAAPAAEINQVSGTPGDLLDHAGVEMGRLAVIDIIGDYVITVPEIPSSPGGSDFLVRAWDFSDPRNPREVGRFGETGHPFMAHGLIKRGNELYIGGDWRTPALRVNADGSLEKTSWSGPRGHFNKSGMMRPWAAQMFWSYNSVGGNAWLELDGERTASWDHLGQTGVIGMPVFMGNLLLYGGDQSKSGMAAYDVSDPYNPRLLDVLKLPAQHPEWGGEYGLGGYWSEVYGHYMVFARRGDNSGIQVVDFSDPSNLRLHCEFLTDDPARGLQGNERGGNPMYPGFQDEYIFAERYKLNIETCEVELILDEEANTVDTSQYARPLGNLLLTGGLGNWRTPGNDAGMGVWVHQAQPDTRAPYVAYHIPRAGQTGYPVMAPISLMIPETLRSETIRPGETLVLREVGGGEVEIDYVLSHTGMLTVDPLEYLKPGTTYELVITGVQDAMKNAMAPYSFRFSTGSAVSGSPTPALPSPPTSDPSPAPAPTPTPDNGAPRIEGIAQTPRGGVAVGDTVQLLVTATDPDGDALEFRRRIEGDSSYGPWQSSPSFTETFGGPGSYAVSVQVRDPAGETASLSTEVLVALSLDYPPASPVSAPLAADPGTGELWVVNPDNDTVASLSGRDARVRFEVATGRDPRNLAVAGDGSVWVTAHDDDAIEVLDGNGVRTARIETGYGTAPFGIVMNREGTEAWVSLYGSGEIAHFDVARRELLGRVFVGPTPRTLALTPRARRLLVTRFVSAEDHGEVWELDADSLDLVRTYRLEKHLEDDDLDDGRGVPNYLAGLVVDRSGRYAFVAGKKDNVDRSLLNDGPDLDDDNMVRTFATVLDLEAGVERRERRIDFDNADSPAALVLSPDGQRLFVAMQGRNQVFVVDVDDEAGRLGSVTTRFETGSAPQGLLLDDASGRLFVKNLTDRTVTLLELGGFLASGGLNPEIRSVTTVANESFTPEELRGKQLFYNAAFGLDASTITGRMSAEGYVSCASCHIDGGEDGRTWDFSGRGEGLRNNISLLGRGGTRFGNVHWSGNFDEIQDFENDIRSVFKGRGLMQDEDFEATGEVLGTAKAGYSDELDALAAYVSSLGAASLPRSPHRALSGELTTQGQRGRTVFSEQGCGDCHRPPAFTDGELHDVGTLRVYSGKRLGEVLPGIKTPSLLGAFATAPYLHDGSAKTLDAVFSTVGGTVVQAEEGTVSGGARVEQEGYSYLREGAGVRLEDRSVLRLSIDGGDPGAGLLRIRVGSSSAGSALRVSLDGVDQGRIPLPALRSLEGQDVSFAEVRTDVTFPGGASELELVLESGSGGSVVVDDVTVSTVADLEAADAHTRVRSLATAQQADLVAYLDQLDQAEAPADTFVLGAAPESTGGSGSGGGGSLGWLELWMLLLTLGAARFAPSPGAVRR
jgi:DNA-binding beta-propeller fold protein YncE